MLDVYRAVHRGMRLRRWSNEADGLHYSKTTDLLPVQEIPVGMS